MADQLPKWAATNRYDIQARATGNPIKDQFRLMMQALLASRFNFAVHYETRQLPVFALVLDKPGKLGPQLQSHSEDVPLLDHSLTAGTAMPAVAGGLPQICGGAYGLPPSGPGRVRAGARDMTLAEIGTTYVFTEAVGVDRPVIDKTGLSGKYDFTLLLGPMMMDRGPSSLSSSRSRKLRTFSIATRFTNTVALLYGSSGEVRPCEAAWLSSATNVAAASFCGR